ncbi:uncharacterized protein ACHE_50558A [Aspergillus chevalieri]|uniref:Uncharacterized protein n=1 Tax=Aspergillus chevalieri TaxID=182096 RepID=A0A7R7ZNY7_ASPCH|nr:uncharacterized protein ACHE_50558A [Aspergillus chevalieri]BCR89360.1 hypothetical protein ACHE_50558A [Aspergillus chevalieri]
MKQALKFGQSFEVQSRGHAHLEWLNATPTTFEQENETKINRWVWLSEAPGGSFCLWDANNPDNMGYMQDGNSVYVGLDDYTIEGITSQGFLTLKEWVPAE